MNITLLGLQNLPVLGTMGLGLIEIPVVGLLNAGLQIDCGAPPGGLNAGTVQQLAGHTVRSRAVPFYFAAEFDDSGHETCQLLDSNILAVTDVHMGDKDLRAVNGFGGLKCFISAGQQGTIV